MFTLHGTGVGDGIVIGVARVFWRQGQEIPEFAIRRDQVEAEIERLQRAFASAGAALEKARNSRPAEAPEVASMLGMHLMILDDAARQGYAAAVVRRRLVNAEAALADHGAELGRRFKDIQDPYLSGKSADVAQVMQRVLGELLGDPGDLSRQPADAFAGKIIVARDLTPTDAVELKRRRIAAFLTNLGGPISHTAILARGMRIPAIVGLHGATRYLRSGDLLVVDGKRGVALVNPDQPALAAYGRRREKILRRIRELDSLRDAEAVTRDGEAVSLFINIDLPSDAALSVAQKICGIGLYRTEFLFMNRARPPTEQEQFEAYAEVVKLARRTVTIRTLDLGGDKPASARPGAGMAATSALGRRAIRLCLNDIGLFKPQLRAIYRASALGPVRLMVPMISSNGGTEPVIRLLAQTKKELTGEGVDFDPAMPIGGMIEVPAAAIAADLFARRLDFLSIGTNDLIQYTLAIDRLDDAVNYLYDPLHPAVLRLIKIVIDAGQAAGIAVAMCGEMAGNSAYTRILLGLGLREFSMDPASLLEVKRQIRESDAARLRCQTALLMKTTEPEKIKRLVAEING